jgi:hypothetical protein
MMHAALGRADADFPVYRLDRYFPLGSRHFIILLLFCWASKFPL